MTPSSPRLFLCLAAFAWTPFCALAQDRPLAPLESEIRAVVTVASRPPDPAKAPYKDCLSQIKVRLTRPCEKLGLAKEAEALLVVWLFQDRKPGPGMQLRAGHEISARLLPYAAVEAGLAQTMRVDETNDFASPVFWVNSFKITGGTPEDFPALAPEPNPMSPEGDTFIDRILRVIAAHGGETIVDPTTQLRFALNGTLTSPQFWLSGYSKTPSPLHLPPIEAIADFHRQLERRGIELVMVFPPVIAAIYPDLATNIAWDLELAGRVDRTFVQFAEEIRKLGVTVVDVLPVLVANRYSEGPDGRTHTIYFPFDQHWTPMGARLAAHEVADAVRRQPWHAKFAVGSSAANFKYAEKIELSTPWQDLPGGTWLSPFAPPPVPGLASRIVPEPGSPSLKDLDSQDGPVHVIGDSFSWTGEEQDSSFCQHLAAALGVPVGRSAIAAGATSASLYRFARDAPLDKIKVVVWEIGMILADGERAPWSRISLDRGPVLALLDELGRSERAGPKLELNASAEMNGVSMRALRADLSVLAQPDPAKPLVAKIGWRGIKLGSNPILIASPALEGVTLANLTSDADGVEFLVFVNRVRISRTERRVPDHFGLEVDLSRFAGQTIDLELGVSSRSNSLSDVACWGEPEVWDAEFAEAPAAEAASQ